MADLISIRLMSVRSVEMIEEITNALLIQETELKRAMTSTDQEIAAMSTRIKQMDVSGRSADILQQAGDTAEVAEDLEVESTSLQSARVVMENLFSETHLLRTGQRIRNVDMSNGG